MSRHERCETIGNEILPAAASFGGIYKRTALSSAGVNAGPFRSVFVCGSQLYACLVPSFLLDIIKISKTVMGKWSPSSRELHMTCRRGLNVLSAAKVRYG